MKNIWLNFLLHPNQIFSVGASYFVRKQLLRYVPLGEPLVEVERILQKKVTVTSLSLLTGSNGVALLSNSKDSNGHCGKIA